MKDKEFYEKAHERVKLEHQTSTLVPNRVVVTGEPESFDEAIQSAYFGQGYQ